MADDAQKIVKSDGTIKTNNSSMDSMSSQEKEESVHYVIINSEDIHKVYDAKIDNFDTFGLHNIVGGAMTVNQTPGMKSNLMPDIQQLMLQNQILMQAVLKNQATYSENHEFSGRKRTSIPTCTVTNEEGMAHVQTKKVKLDASSAHALSKQKQDFINELDALIENEHAQKEMYSDISSSEESDRFDTDSEDEENETKDKDTQRNDKETINIVQSMKNFVSSEEKSGPKINGDLATVINEGLRKRANEDKLKELSKKYAKPANLTNLTVPKINTGIWKNMTATHKIRDVQLQRIQNLIAKAACPLAYLLDLFLEKSTKKESLTEDEMNSATQLIRDGFQLTQVAFTDVTYRRRTFVKEDLQDKYKGLCNDDMPVTDNLFGDDIKEKMKDLDAEYSMGIKLKKSSYGKERSRRSYSEKLNKGRGAHRYGPKPRQEGKTNGFLYKTGLKKKKERKRGTFQRPQPSTN